MREQWHHLTEAGRRALDALPRRQRRRARNVSEIEAEHETTGQRVADEVARWMGSWRFILVQSGSLGLWIVVNAAAWVRHWDPYPFILLNLALSFQAAYAAPVIMMSQNRQAAKDRLAAEEDYLVNLWAELEVAAIHDRLDDLAERR